MQPGTNIAFDLYLRSTASAQFGVAELDALNTFKITTIDLPPGYSFRADSDGFLSKFGAAVPITPVPEPSTWGAVQRRHRGAGLAAAQDPSLTRKLRSGPETFVDTDKPLWTRRCRVHP